ncbi:MAG: 2-isopropylmalate synthase [Calditrichaeota bacterium]|nr:MAG: 2-isopropylmalate synthase [Calditrichota bacterium]MBL1205626.1 2-isopropylmalate synthase [Calditrichota bacterium]NOG45454.1 2-isopropylmalate synthase [Calditrichota bacterium]
MIEILDATLREGEQTPGVYFDSHIKLAIADLLDQIGIGIIEAGHPMVTPEINDAVKQLAGRGLNAKVGAHSRSLIHDVDLALACDVDFLGIFYCVSEERLNTVFKKDIHTAVDQIASVIAYAKQNKPSLVIRYTPEDTVRSPFQNVVDAAVAAVQAGADIISIADTTGFMIPGTTNNFYDYVSRLKEALAAKGLSPKIAVHCHNDRGYALTNAIDGFRAGAEIIDATVLGLGERAGIVDLAQLLVTLKNDFGVEKNWDLSKLPELYQLVSEYSGIPIPANFPVIGENAFTHCAGVHSHAAVKNPAHYQSLDPKIIGKEMQVSLDHMSGISSIDWALEKLNLEIEASLKLNVLDHVKSIGQKGRTVNLSELKHIVDWCEKSDKQKA